MNKYVLKGVPVATKFSTRLRCRAVSMSYIACTPESNNCLSVRHRLTTASTCHRRICLDQDWLTSIYIDSKMLMMLQIFKTEQTGEHLDLLKQIKAHIFTHLFRPVSADFSFLQPESNTHNCYIFPLERKHIICLGISRLFKEHSLERLHHRSSNRTSVSPDESPKQFPIVLRDSKTKLQ